MEPKRSWSSADPMLLHFGEAEVVDLIPLTDLFFLVLAALCSRNRSTMQLRLHGVQTYGVERRAPVWPARFFGSSVGVS